MTLTPEHRDFLERIGDFTEDQFLQPQYASMILRPLRQFSEQGRPLTLDDAAQWAREREWTDMHAGILAGVAWAVRYGLDPHYGAALREQ